MSSRHPAVKLVPPAATGSPCISQEASPVSGPVVRTEPTRAFLSTSGLDRAERCPWPHALPKDRNLDAQESTAATRGTSIHRFIEVVKTGQITRDQALAAVPDDVYETCQGIHLDAIPPGLHEVALAYNIRTRGVRMLERTQHRDYGSLDPFEIPGTADLLVSPNYNRGIPLVIDWKTGYDTLSPAQGDLQLGFHALCLRELSRIDTVEVGKYRIDEHGRFIPDLHVLDVIELEEIHSRIVRVHARVEQARQKYARGESPDVVDGKHCKYCPAKGSCPTFAKQAAALATFGDRWIETISQQIENNDDAAYWRERNEKAKHIVAEIDKLLRARAERSPIRMPDGSTIRLAKEERKRIDDRIALPVLREIFPATTVEAMCRITLTQASVRAACGDMAEEVLKLLDQRGAIVRYQQPTLRTSRS